MLSACYILFIYDNRFTLSNKKGTHACKDVGLHARYIQPCIFISVMKPEHVQSICLVFNQSAKQTRLSKFNILNLIIIKW